MALFNKTKKESKKETAENKGAEQVSNLNIKSDAIIKPRITEKASSAAAGGVYVFDIADAANKRDVLIAVKNIYKVTPVKVSVVRVPSKKIFVRGKWGVKSAGKKAYVYLKEGEKIEFV